MTITSINSLIEALREKLPINKVFISKAKKDSSIETVIRLCRENRVIFQMVPRETLSRKAGPGNQGVFAEISPIRFYTLEEILGNITTGLILILDSINDTGNLGAIIRSAVAADVDAILVPLRNSAPINETVLKTSAGALLKARIVQSRNLSNDIKTLKENNFWIAGTVMEPQTSIPYYQYDFTANTAIIVGNEHKGIAPLLKKNSDQLVYIPHSSKVESLNVSAAASVILFEALKQKNLN
ncbi:MAG: 23S rRNA (guanosine(2251)-2'-O)-methyltransferase RlmB [bacterium]|nr:23S rRNA (guanosine(2251)-2'-O)-methyltransferase RlmB [bacterium]